MRRSAFTMIELIFAIVIIAIVVISLPTMMKTNEDAMEGNIVQEALFASSAKVMQTLSFPWDENSSDNTNTGTYGKVVDLPSGTVDYNRSDANGTLDINSSFRVGHIQQANHRRFHDYTLTHKNVSALTSGGNTALNNATQTGIPFINPGSTAAGYKNTYTMDVNVTYIPDTPSSTFTFANTGTSTASNMKLITVTIKDSSGNPLTLLRSYSANIGEFDFAKRRF